MPVNGSFLDKNGLTYLWGKLSDILDGKMTLPPGVRIEAGDDLHATKYRTQGAYYVADQTDAAQIDNTPVETSGFTMLVLKTSNADRCMHVAFPNSRVGDVLCYVEKYANMGSGTAGWTDWFAVRYGDDAIPTSGSTHYMTSGAIYTALQKVINPLSMMVDEGSKNVIKLGFTKYVGTGVTTTNNGDGTMSIHLTSALTANKVCIFALDSDATATADSRNTLPIGEYMVKATGDSHFRIQMYESDGSSTVNLLSETSWDSDVSATYAGTKPYVVFRIIAASGTPAGTYTIAPCCIPLSKYNINSTSTKYAPTNYELYQMAKVLEVTTQTPASGSTYADLNNYTMPGTYTFPATVSPYLSNSPVNSGTVVLEVSPPYSSGIFKHTVFKIGDADNKFYTRYFYSSAFDDWYEFSGLRMTK